MTEFETQVFGVLASVYQGNQALIFQEHGSPCWSFMSQEIDTDKINDQTELGRLLQTHFIKHTNIYLPDTMYFVTVRFATVINVVYLCDQLSPLGPTPMLNSGLYRDCKWVHFEQIADMYDDVSMQTHVVFKALFHMDDFMSNMTEEESNEFFSANERLIDIETGSPVA